MTAMVSSLQMSAESFAAESEGRETGDADMNWDAVGAIAEALMASSTNGSGKHEGYVHAP